MSNEKELKALRDALLATENSLRTAKHILANILGGDMNSSSVTFSAEGEKYSEGDTTIVE